MLKRSLFSALVLGFAVWMGVSAVVSAEAVKLVLWHSYRGEEKAALEEVVNKYNGSQQDIVIEMLTVPYDAFADKITNAVPRGKGPDIFIYAHDRIGDWAKSGVLEPVGFWAKDELRKRFPATLMDAMTFEDNLYGLPTSFKCTVLYYNKTLVKQPPKTTDEMITLAKTLTDKAKQVYGLVYENGLFYYNSSWLQGFGGRVFDEKMNPVLNSAENAQALQFVQDLLRKHQIMPDEISNTLVTTLFNENKAAMVISGPWLRGELKPGLDYGLTTLPIISANNKPAMPFATVEGILLSAKSEHKKEAFQFMEYFTTKESALVMATTGKQPVSNQEALNDPKVQSDPFLGVFKAQLANARPMPNLPEMKMVWTPADIAVGKVLNNAATPQDALQEAQDKIMKDVERFRMTPQTK